MNTNDLLNELRQNEIKEETCLVLPSRRVEGALCLTHESDGRWLVSFVERGDVTEHYFDEEDAACRYFLKWAISEPTYFKDFSASKLEAIRERSAKLLSKYGFVT